VGSSTKILCRSSRDNGIRDEKEKTNQGQATDITPEASRFTNDNVEKDGADQC